MNALYEAKDERNSSTHCKKVAELHLLSDHMGDRGNGRYANCKGHSKRYTNKAKRETVAVWTIHLISLKNAWLQEKLQISVQNNFKSTNLISPSKTAASVEITQLQVFTIQGFAFMYSLSLESKISFTVNRTNGHWKPDSIIIRDGRTCSIPDAIVKEKFRPNLNVLCRHQEDVRLLLHHLHLEQVMNRRLFKNCEIRNC